MPRPHPPEFRQRAVELARLRDKPVAEIAADLGISDSCLRNWMAQADVDEGRREGLSSRERDELVELRREAAPRPVWRAALAVVGRRSAGQVDDIRRVATDWGFDVDDVLGRTTARGWHAEQDPEAPLAPWQGRTVELHVGDGCNHDVSDARWQDVLEWLRRHL